MTFITKTHGKWILCGEQSVLRGHPAIVFPLGNVQLSLQYDSSSSPLQIICNEAYQENSIRKVWALAQGPQTGTLKLHSNIPCGQGMGASAALCLAIAQYMHRGQTDFPKVWQFAKHLEDSFHGRSSGLDILGSGTKEPLWFANGQWQTIALNWQPQFILTPSEEEGKTASAIQKVHSLWEQSPQQAQAIDETMHQAVVFAAQALQGENLQLLAQSIHMAHDCFQAWGLITPKMARKIKTLYQQGAVAVKPTGSGGGGFLLSLWEEPSQKAMQEGFLVIPPNDNRSHLA